MMNMVSGKKIKNGRKPSMPNPSEMERVEQERALEFNKSSIREGFHSKATKEHLIARIRELEALLGIESKPYNSTDF